jgi:HSP20 family protein
MLTRYGDFDSAFALLDEFRRQMDRVWDGFETSDRPWALSAATWPLVNVYDSGQNLVLKADVPGVSEKDIHVSLEADTVSISGERKIEPPKGYTVHRQERGSVKFARTMALPCRADAEKVLAEVADGVLTITIAKAPEAQPRQIAVRTR